MYDIPTTLTRITNHVGVATVTQWHTAEPKPGSVVLVHGEHGTAWQRYFEDDMWHRVGGGRARPWTWLLSQRNVMLAYDAPARRD